MNIQPRPKSPLPQIPCPAVRRPRLRVLAALALSFAALLYPPGTDAQEDEPAPEADWRRIGSFTGSPFEGAGEFFDNELFREARSGDLFQELGDLDVSFGQTWSATSLDASITYSRRVLDKHRELPPGTAVGDGDLSWFQTVNSARAKTALDFDYLPDSSASIGVGLHAESGFVLTAAETQAPRQLGPEFSRTVSRENLRSELAGYWSKNDARFRKRILPRISRTVLSMLDALATEINIGFEDTEKGALYFEGFVEPMTLFVDLGFPLKTEMFTTGDPRLQAGDGATYTAFIGVSPLRLSAHELGMRASFEYFYRLIRETTVIEQADDHVLVRIRTIAAKGREITPIKIRPEIHLGILRYGYTFLQDRRDDGQFRVADLVYRFDLKTPEGRSALDDLLGTKNQNRVRLKTPLEAAAKGLGVEILSAELRQGDRRDMSLLARFPSWFRTKRQSLAVVQDIQIGKATVREATQGQSSSLKVRNLGQRRDQGATAVLTLQATHPDGTVKAMPRAIEVRTTMSDRKAKIEPRRQIASLWRTLPGHPEPPPELFGTEDVGVVASFAAGARGDALTRLLATRSEETWRAVGQAILGGDQGEVWLTAGQRALWRAAHGFKDRRRLDSAERFVSWFDDLRYRTARGEIDGRGWTKHALRREDFPILSRLILAAGGSSGTGDGGSLSAEIWTDEMPRPLRITRGRTPISRLGSLAAEPEAAPVGTVASPNQPVGTNGSPQRLEGSSVQTAAQARDIDSLRSSAPRLLAGRMFVVEAPPGAPGVAGPKQFYLSLFSDLRFAPDHRVRIELRRSRIRADLPLAVVGIPTGQPKPVPEGPFALSKFRYDLRLPTSLSERIDDRHPYSVYVRVLNAEGLPLTEEEPLHFRVPRKKASSSKR